MSSVARGRAIVVLSVCAVAWLGLAAPAVGQEQRGMDPNQGESLVEVTLPSKAAAIRLQLRAARYGVEFNDHYLRRNANGTVTAMVFGTARTLARLHRAGYKLSSTIEGPATWEKRVADYKAGKDKAFNSLVGQVMKLTRGKANPQQVNEILKRRLGIRD